MELQDAIKGIVDQFGKEIIAKKKFIYMVADYHSFKDNPAEKIILTAIVNAGYSARLLNISSGGDVLIIQRQIINEICNNYGFREELVSQIINCLTSSSGITTPKKNIVNDSDYNYHQVNSRELPYTEEYIMSLYPILFENVPYHAHMDFDIFQKKLNLDSQEAFRLFKFLKDIGVYKFNPNSDNYDMNIDSKDSLSEIYKNYYVQKGIHHIPLSGGRLLKREYLETIIKKLYKYKIISKDDIKSILPSNNDNEWYVHDIFCILQHSKVIDEMGRSLDPYLTSEAIVNNIINRECISFIPIESNMSKSQGAKESDNSSKNKTIKEAREKAIKSMTKELTKDILDNLIKDNS